MRISHRSLGLFVPGQPWMVPQNPFLGPGMAGLREFVPVQTWSVPPQPAGIGRIGDFVKALITLPPQPRRDWRFAWAQEPCIPIPVNSLTAAAAWIERMRRELRMRRLKCGGHGISGLGQAMTDFEATFSNLTSGNTSAAWTSFMSFLEDPVIGTVPVWMVGGGALLASGSVLQCGGDHSRYSRGRKAYSAGRRAYA